MSKLKEVSMLAAPAGGAPCAAPSIMRGGDVPGKAAFAAFADPDWVATSEAYQWVPGTIFLGLNNCDLSTRRDGRGRPTRAATGGQAVGFRDDRHLMTIAGSRAGKSRSVLLANLATYPGSMLVIDPKGDLANETLRWREAKFGPAYVLDPFLKSGIRTSHAFNPLDLLRAESLTLVEDAGLIADALVPDEPGAQDPHWNESARQFIGGLVLHVATSPQFAGRRTLKSVNECVRDALNVVADAEGGAVYELLGHMWAEDGVPEHAVDAIRAAASGFFDKADEERGGVLSVVRRHLHLLSFRQMQKVLDHTSAGLDLRRMKRESRLTRGITLYLSLPALRMGTCSRWLRMIVNMALAAFEEEPNPAGADALPVIMCLDEFAVLGHMKTLEVAAGQIAGLGCRLWTILQDLTQLQALYGNRWETFLGNAGVVQLFGNTDMTTLDWISRRCGTTAVTRSSYGFADRDQLSRTGNAQETVQVVEHPLVTAEEASRLFARDDPDVRQLVLIAGRPPMVLHRSYFDLDPRFSDAHNSQKLRTPPP